MTSFSNTIFKRFNLYLIFSIIGSVILLLSLITFFKWGPTISSDTLTYFNLSKKVSAGYFPYSRSYSPGYPALVSLFRYILSSGFSISASVISLIVYITSFILWFYLLKEIFVANTNKYLIFITAILISNLWWSVKILIYAHADSIFYIFCLLIILFLSKWFKGGKLIYWVIVCLIASISIWIKYNGLIFFPFLVLVPFLFYGFNSKSFISFIPIIFILPSFLIFKNINGQVIHHLSSSNISYFFWNNETSKDTLITNLSDSGKVFVEYFLTSYFSSKFNVVVFFGINLLFGIYFIILLVRFFGKKEKKLIYLFFIILYVFGLGFISQFSNHTEMNIRTLFPALIFLTVFIFSLVPLKLSFNIFILSFVLVGMINFIRTFHGYIDWYNRAPMDSFVFVEKFKKRGSVVKCNELVKFMNIEPSKIYTNNSRYLTASLDYEFVKPFENELEFQRGKVRPLGDLIKKKRNQEIQRTIFEGNGIVILFDFQDLSTIGWFDPFVYNLICIDNDIIIYKK